MKKSLKFKFLVAFLAVALGSVFFTGLVINKTVGSSFYEYMEKKQESKNKEIVEDLTVYYKEYGKWEIFYCEWVAKSVIPKEGSMKVKDEEGSLVFESKFRGKGIMKHRIPGGPGEYREYTYPVVIDGEKVGEVDIGYFGPGFISPQDVAFRSRVNLILLVSVISAVILAGVGSFIFSSMLTGPISKIIKSTKEMSGGDLKTRVPNIDREDELGQLARSVNRLGEWVDNLETMRRQMTSDVAHELRTPLATLQGHLEAIMDGVWEPTPERIAVCHSEVVRLSVLVKDMEKLSSYEKEAVQLDISEFDVGNMLKEISDYFKIMFEDKDIQLNVDVGEHLTYKGDKDKIKQAVINLISNALKYTDAGGRAGVKAYKEDNMLVIQVEDTGKGISREDLPFIFERFYRADKSRSRREGGAGIGLSIVKAIVELHEGKIEVDSKEGKGSIFKVSLPL